MKVNLAKEKRNKSNFLKKTSVILTLTSFITVGGASSVFAATNNSKLDYSNIAIESNYENSLNKKDFKENIAENNMLSGYAVQLEDTDNKKTYTFSELNKLSYDELIDFIKTKGYEKVQGLFEFNSDSYSFFGDRNRVQAIINALDEAGKTYTPEDDKGIPSLVEFLRAAYYLGYYNEQLSYLNTLEYKEKCLPAMKSIEGNANFRLGTQAQDEVVSALGRLIGNTTADAEVINNTAPILKSFKDNIGKYGSSFYKGNAVFNVMKGIDYCTNTSVYDAKDYNAKNTIYYGKINPYMNELESLCSIGENLNTDNAWVVNNAIYFTGRMSVFREDNSISQRALENAMNECPYLSYQYISAASELDSKFGGKNSQGEDIDFKSIKEAAQNKYLSKTYSFDDGKFIVKAGDKVSVEKIQRLYWASNEVKAQFFRVVQNDKALEEGNPDDVLNVVIYNSPEEYKLNLLLNGYSTDNGGIYIEPKGTFYTYERTPEESIYTLEELFRHEFTHYLQGRYVVPGMWGRGDFYKEGVLTWYEEGTAEFFAGSTRTEGIKPRKSVAGNIGHNRSERMNLNRLLHAKYGSWDFYHYGFAFSNYMYNNGIETFKNLTNYIMNDNVQAYQNSIQLMCSDYNLENAYQEYMDNLVNNIEQLNVPLVSDDYTIGHSEKDINEICNDIKEASNIKELSIKAEQSQFFSTYDMSGTYVGERSNGEAQDWNNMNKKLDGILKELAKKDWDGYGTVTAYFVNHRVNQDGNYEYDVVFHGINKDLNAPKNRAPKAIIRAKDSANVGEKIILDASESKDSDGEVVNYEWTFSNGDIINGAKVEYIFNEEGTQSVKLKVTDNEGATRTTNKNIEIKEVVPTEYMYEKEKNNTFDEANKIDKANKMILGSFRDGDTADKYYFDVLEGGNVKISLENTDSIGLNWTLYKEDDLKNYILYPEQNTTNMMKGEKFLEPGRYYINVYTYDEKSGDYNMVLRGAVANSEGQKEPEVLKETENNDAFENANEVKANSKINGQLSNEDNKDIFSINIENPSDLDIVVKNKDNIKMNWLLYSDNDLSNYMDYADIDGDKLSKTCKLNPGKYYLCVYQYDNSGTGDYTIELVNK
ncbi:collagenase [Clostridium sp. B9]|uniref:collagenase n=1 Tax=Clostridium sp. B9 TaxID=3423224 RepID=UPI003D2F0ECF